MKRHFAPRPLPTLIAIAMLVILIMLGNWQRRRYYESIDSHAHYTRQHDELPPIKDLSAIPGDGHDRKRLAALQYRRAELTGTLEPHSVQFLTARYMFGRRGYGVMMPLRVSSGPYKRVLVHLGWVPTEKVAAHLREVAAAPDRTIKGRFAITSPGANVKNSGYLLGHPTWVRAHADAISARVERMEPRLLLQAGQLATGQVVRTDKYPIDGYAHPVRMAPSKHVEYAATWYGLAVTLVFVWVAFSLRNRETAPQVEGSSDASA